MTQHQVGGTGRVSKPAGRSLAGELVEVEAHGADQAFLGETAYDGSRVASALRLAVEQHHFACGGSCDQAHKVGIPVVLDRPGVGERMAPGRPATNEGR